MKEFLYDFIEGDFSVATSSIFVNMKITDPEKIEEFVEALEASAGDPRRVPTGPVSPVVTDVEEIRKLMAGKLRGGGIDNC